MIVSVGFPEGRVGAFSMKDQNPSNAEDGSVVAAAAPQLISLDQKFICFDVEQLGDAKQRLQVSRLEGKRVAWRVRTNAPTRYIVSPNGGVLDDATPTQPLVVELVGNRYNPQHKLVVQALQLLDSESPKDIWKKERAKNHEFLQSLNLELSTTLMNLEITQQMCVERGGGAQASASLASLLEQSSTSGRERVQELEAIIQMLNSDTERLRVNVEKTTTLKTVLEGHLESRKKTVGELDTKVKNLERRQASLVPKVKEREKVLADLEARNKTSDQQCSIM